MIERVKTPPEPAPVMARPARNVGSELENAVRRLPRQKMTAETSTHERGEKMVLIRPVKGPSDDMAT